MKVKKIKINNFRGLKDLEVNLFDFNNFNGKNGIGKSTIIDSVMWCLCGETLVYGKQDSDNRNSNSIRDIINVVLTIDFDGTETTLERKYYDNWVIDKEGKEKFSEVKNLFFINGAKYKKDEYFDFIKNIVSVPNNIKFPKDFNLLRCLMDYNYYSSIDYKISRKFTEELLTLKPDEEILNEERFALIRGDMQIANYDFAKCLNKYANTKKETEVLINDKTSLLNNYKAKLEKLREQVKEEIEKNFDFEPKTTLISKRLEENRLIIQNLVENQKKGLFELQNYEELIQYSLNEKKDINKCPYCGEVLNKEELELKERKNNQDNIEIIKLKEQELEKQIKELKTIVFNCELKKDLVQEFKQTKLALIKNSTYEVFPQLDFEILEVNENTGAVKEVCYAKLKGVEFKGINDGHRKLVGILIIEDIKKALGIADLPIIFDKRADIDDNMLAEIRKITNAQLITTSVSNDNEIINKGE